MTESSTLTPMDSAALKIVFVKHVHGAAKSPGGWLAFIALVLICAAIGTVWKAVLVFVGIAYLWFLITSPGATLFWTVGIFLVGMVKKIPDTFVLIGLAAWLIYWAFFRKPKSEHKKIVDHPVKSARPNKISNDQQ